MWLWKTTNFSLFLKNSKWQSEKCFLFGNLREFAVRVLCFLMRFEKLVYHDIFRPFQRKSTSFFVLSVQKLARFAKIGVWQAKNQAQTMQFF